MGIRSRSVEHGNEQTKKEIPITSSDFWQSEDECNMELMKHVFRSATDEEMPLLEERLACLREAGQVLYEVCLNSLLCMKRYKKEKKKQPKNGRLRKEKLKRKYRICLLRGPFASLYDGRSTHVAP